MCVYLRNCSRRMCFFAHKPCEMRVDVAKKYIELESAQFGVSEQWIKGIIYLRWSLKGTHSMQTRV